MASRVNVEKTWRQIAAEVAQEDDPDKVTQLTQELTHALKRELQMKADATQQKNPTASRSDN